MASKPEQALRWALLGCALTLLGTPRAEAGPCWTRPLAPPSQGPFAEDHGRLDKARLETIDRVLFDSKAGWRESDHSPLESLLGIGPALEAELLARYCQGTLQEPGDEGRLCALNRFQDDLLLTALGQLSGALSRSALADAGGFEATVKPSAQGRRWLALCGAVLPASAARGLVGALQSHELEREQRQTLREAIARWARRDVELYPALAPLLRKGPPELSMTLVQGLCDGGEARVLDHLESELVRGGLETQTALSLAGRLADCASLEQRLRWARLAAGWCTSQRPALAAEACRLIGSLRAGWEAESLLPALEAEPTVSSAALTALRALTNQRFPGSRRLWKHYLEGERDFQSSQLPALLSRARHAPLAQMAAVLRDLQAHPLFRDQSAAALEPRLHDPDPRVRQLLEACLNSPGHSNLHAAAGRSPSRS